MRLLLGAFDIHAGCRTFIAGRRDHDLVPLPAFAVDYRYGSAPGRQGRTARRIALLSIRRYRCNVRRRL